jgi:hypothetical protein
MSCLNFNSNTQPKVFFSGTLPANFCHTTWATTFEAFRDALAAALPDNYSTFIISDTTPIASDRDKVWVQVDPNNCRPIGANLFINGLWIRIGASIFYGTDTGSANLLNVNSTTPDVNWVQEGHIFAIKASLANTGACTITIKAGGTQTIYSTVAIKKNGSSALEGFEFLAGSVILLIWDGTAFQLLNPRVSNPTSTGTSSGSSGGGTYNLSFEDDLNADGIPDSWAWTPYAGPGTVSVDAITTIAGGKSVKIHVPFGGGTNGGGSLSSSLIPCQGGSITEISWWTRSTLATIANAVMIQFYDASRVAVGSPVTLWSNAKSNPVGTWVQMGGITKSSSSARYLQIVLVGGSPGTVGTGDVYYDDVQLAPPKFNNKVKYDKRHYYSNGDHPIVPGSRFWFPAGVYQAKVTAVGSGGGGSITTAADAAKTGGGGGGGATEIKYFNIDPLAACNPAEISIGRPGSGEGYNLSSYTTVSDGEDTSFQIIETFPSTGPKIVAKGGLKGTPLGAGGVGGVAPSANPGDVSIAGQDGFPYGDFASTTGKYGMGGSSTIGAGGPACPSFSSFQRYTNAAISAATSTYNSIIWDVDVAQGAGGGGGRGHTLGFGLSTSGFGGCGEIIIEFITP